MTVLIVITSIEVKRLGWLYTYIIHCSDSTVVVFLSQGENMPHLYPNMIHRIGKSKTVKS